VGGCIVHIEAMDGGSDHDRDNDNEDDDGDSHLDDSFDDASHPLAKKARLRYRVECAGSGEFDTDDGMESPPPIKY